MACPGCRAWAERAALTVAASLAQQGIATMAILDMAGLTAINASGFLPEHDFAAIGISTYGASAVILAALVLKEKVSPGQWAGIGLIVSGVAVISIA